MENKITVLDGNNLAHIAFHRGSSIILKKLKEEKEDRTYKLQPEDYPSVEGMMYHVFFLKLHKLYKDFKNSYFVIAWDSPGSTQWRREIYPDYKAGRVYGDPIWQVLFTGMDNLRVVLDEYPLSQVKVENVEADDIMYKYAQDLHEKYKIVIITGDSDLLQITQEFPSVKIYHPIKSKFVKPPKEYDYCLWKAIKGDKSDDIPGLPGYGDKRSAKLAIELGEKPNTKLSPDQLAIISRNIQLISIKNNPNLERIPIDEDIILSSSRINPKAIKKFFYDHKLADQLEKFHETISIFS